MMPYHNYLESVGGDKYQLSVYATEVDGAVLGASFMIGSNVIFDTQHKRIGFAYSECNYQSLRPYTTATTTTTAAAGGNGTTTTSTSTTTSTTITATPLSPNTPALAKHENIDGSITGPSATDCLELIPKTECTATCQRNDKSYVAQGEIIMMVMIVMMLLMMMMMMVMIVMMLLMMMMMMMVIIVNRRYLVQMGDIMWLLMWCIVVMLMKDDDDDDDGLLSHPTSYIYTYTFTYTPYIYIHIHTYIHAYIYIHTYIHTCIDAFIHTFIHTYIYTYTITYSHAFIHTYIRTILHRQVNRIGWASVIRTWGKWPTHNYNHHHHHISSTSLSLYPSSLSLLSSLSSYIIMIMINYAMHGIISGVVVSKNCSEHCAKTSIVRGDPLCPDLPWSECSKDCMKTRKVVPITEAVKVGR